MDWMRGVESSSRNFQSVIFIAIAGRTASGCSSWAVRMWGFQCQKDLVYCIQSWDSSHIARFHSTTINANGFAVCRSKSALMSRYWHSCLNASTQLMYPQQVHGRHFESGDSIKLLYWLKRSPPHKQTNAIHSNQLKISSRLTKSRFVEWKFILLPFTSRIS